MPRYRDAERDEVMSGTRRALLDAATEAFSHEGYHGANINRISSAAGYAKGTIYNYFPSKRALMLALIEAIAASHVQSVSERVLAEEQSIRRLERFFEAGFDWIVDHLAQGRVMLATLNGPDAEFKARMYQAYTPMFQLVGREILAHGIQRGVFRPVDPAPTAGLLMTIYLGFGSTVDEGGRPALSADRIVDFCVHALRASPPGEVQGA